MQEIQLNAEEQGVNLTRYVRSCICGGLNDNPEYRRTLQELTYEIHKIGTNINQIAYHNNLGMLTTKEKELLFAFMKDIRKGLLEVVKYGNHKADNY